MVCPGLGAPPDRNLECSGYDLSSVPNNDKENARKVHGVSKVDVAYEKKQVLVTFDDAKTNTDALVKATTNAGFPSQPDKTAK
jgi:mercuric ion binding protein